MFRCWGKMFIDEIDIYYEKTLVEIVIYLLTITFS